ncbi:MAG: hypothetical protein UV60_C0009G0018 [Parcubacteria group bacterium GW2011_GWA2_43_11]|nr:MAG: hypothetical protein UU89_C0011G0011 [Parcubacteria group bacterium GW2011_GWC2_42_11]KKS85297.1 MAG: hypothetical protein UV60_C0009G0018 [Parcubacteria group bacterium GW2011_GWA2_43_11]
MLTEKFWRSLMLLLSVFAVTTLSGCAAVQGDGNIISHPHTVTIPESMSDEDRDILVRCVTAESTDREKKGLVGIELKEEPTRSEKLLNKMMFFNSAPIRLIIDGKNQIAQEKDRQEIDRHIRKCVAKTRQQQ